MISERWTARLVGLLFIIGTVAGVSSYIGLQPQGAPDLLVNVYENQTNVITGALFVLIMGIAIAPIPVFLYPILKKESQALALGYIVFRTLEVVTYLGVAVSWLLMVSLSREYAVVAAPDVEVFNLVGSMIKATSGWIDPVMVMIFSVSALILNYLFIKSGFIPRWLSGWGFIGGAIHLVEGLLTLYGYTDFDVLGVPLFLPIAIQEMVYALWLIIKGFSVTSETLHPI